MSGTELTPEELLSLQFEEKWWKRAGAKNVAIRRRFKLEPTRYYQRPNAPIDRPEAEAVHPLLVRRLQRTRSAPRRIVS